MEFKALFGNSREKMAERWVALVAGTYPSRRSQSFFLNEKDPFANPVGHTLHTVLPEVLKGLVEGLGDAELEKLLDPLIRIRAVQEFTPKEAVTFVFYLKDLAREALGSKILEDKKNQSMLYAFDKRVDDLSLIAFSLYMACREQIWSFKSRHVVERSINLLEKADILCEVENLGVDILPQRIFRKMQKDAAEKKEAITN
ncbi:RsbRD-like negative regulator of sigma factor [Desulfobotulus alkaliphilus]|uniref:RsbRD-like negative regulator of sigma factor n=1 Tax=Desulfobotulus alkaliphilus TaxID=622671 RepID=A0A562R4D1_9BACT|nr:RsbRD N-terminal domain-containing protein [Desulfobotulus alkaliphilus]TWI63952.1 RsbRD-like negative regulator of sigma factor [Desulfobotulus alkaliphilus]